MNENAPSGTPDYYVVKTVNFRGKSSYMRTYRIPKQSIVYWYDEPTFHQNDDGQWIVAGHRVVMYFRTQDTDGKGFVVPSQLEFENEEAESFLEQVRMDEEAYALRNATSS